MLVCNRLVITAYMYINILSYTFLSQTWDISCHFLNLVKILGDGNLTKLGEIMLKTWTCHVKDRKRILHPPYAFGRVTETNEDLHLPTLERLYFDFITRANKDLHLQRETILILFWFDFIVKNFFRFWLFRCICGVCS